MNDALVVESRPLSQVERVVDTFVAPSKTFTDILRSTSWWLPFLLAILVSIPFAYAIERNVGFETVAQHEMQQNSFAAEQMSQQPASEQAIALRRYAAGYKFSTYGRGVFTLIFVALMALVLWMSFNFGLGAKTTYSQMFATAMYAALPRLLLPLLSAILLFAGVGLDNFDYKNPVGTNLGYYMPDSAPWLKTAMGFFDVFGLWTLVLLIIGCAIVARKSKGQSAMIIIGWWVVILLVMVGFTAATS